MARYSLFVLKVPLNTNQLTNARLCWDFADLGSDVIKFEDRFGTFFVS